MLCRGGAAGSAKLCRGCVVVKQRRMTALGSAALISGGSVCPKAAVNRLSDMGRRFRCAHGKHGECIYCPLKNLPSCPAQLYFYSKLLTVIAARWRGRRYDLDSLRPLRHTRKRYANF